MPDFCGARRTKPNHVPRGIPETGFFEICGLFGRILGDLRPNLEIREIYALCSQNPVPQVPGEAWLVFLYQQNY